MNCAYWIRMWWKSARDFSQVDPIWVDVTEIGFPIVAERSKHLTHTHTHLHTRTYTHTRNKQRRTDDDWNVLSAISWLETVTKRPESNALNWLGSIMIGAVWSVESGLVALRLFTRFLLVRPVLDLAPALKCLLISNISIDCNIGTRICGICWVELFLIGAWSDPIPFEPADLGEISSGIWSIYSGMETVDSLWFDWMGR